MAATAALSGFGTVLARGGTAIGDAYTAIAEVMDINFSGTTVTKLDASNMDSPNGHEESIPGMAAIGEFTFDVNYNLDTATHETLQADVETVPQTRRYWKITFPPASSSVGNWIFFGYVSKFIPKVPFNGKMTATVGLQGSGKYTRAG